MTTFEIRILCCNSSNEYQRLDFPLFHLFVGHFAHSPLDYPCRPLLTVDFEDENQVERREVKNCHESILTVTECMELEFKLIKTSEPRLYQSCNFKLRKVYRGFIHFRVSCNQIAKIGCSEDFIRWSSFQLRLRANRNESRHCSLCMWNIFSIPISKSSRCCPSVCLKRWI